MFTDIVIKKHKCFWKKMFQSFFCDLNNNAIFLKAGPSQKQQNQER